LSKINWLFTIIESRVTPGSTKSYKEGVVIYIYPFLSLKIKNIFEAPTYKIWSSNNHNTCWWFLATIYFDVNSVAP
jgi:hypothetical protein